jgi:hypothetical protein
MWEGLLSPVVEAWRTEKAASSAVFDIPNIAKAPNIWHYLTSLNHLHTCLPRAHLNACSANASQ